MRQAPAPPGQPGDASPRWLQPVLLAPILLALIPILSLFGETAAPWTVVLRPAGIVTVVVAGVVLLSARISRRPTPVAIAASGIVLAAFDVRLAVLIAPLLVGAIAIQRIGRRTAGLAPRVLMAFTILLVVITAGRAILNGALTLDDFNVAIPDASGASAASNSPGIYLLLVDGYPRQDSLATEFSFDNEPFLTQLEGLGFSVNRRAETPFARTELTLSALDVADVRELGRYVRDPARGPIAIRREVRRNELGNSSVMDAFRKLGYRLVYVPPATTFVEWDGWDERLDPGGPNDFESVLIQRTPLRYVLDEWMMERTRERVAQTITAWAAPRAQSLVFAHVMSPHSPFLWADGGESITKPTRCWYTLECALYTGFPHTLRISEDEYADGVAPQVAQLNTLVIEATNRIIAADPDATIVIFSDHGTRYRREGSDEAYRTLFAARGTSADQANGLFVAMLEELQSAKRDD